MPQETKSNVGHEISRRRATLQGCAFDLSDESAAMEALEKAFDYRGDVTLGLADGREVMGYLFDRRKGTGLADSCVRLMTATDDEPVRVTYAEIRSLSFSGRDAAHGKSFETWVKKYVEKKLAGEEASIHDEALE